MSRRAKLASTNSEYATDKRACRWDSHGVKSVVFEGFDDVWQLLLFLNVQTFNGRFQELPFLAVWDTIQQREVVHN